MKNYHKIITEPGRGRRGRKAGARRRRRSLRTEHNPSGRERVAIDEPAGAELEPDHASLTGERRCYSRRGVRMGPLVKFLRSRIGSPWRAVWAEVCAMPGGAFDQHHIREHVLGEVDIGKNRHARWRPFYPFSVDHAGVLRETKFRSTWQQQRREQERLAQIKRGWFDDERDPLFRYLRECEGVWYRLTLAHGNRAPDGIRDVWRHVSRCAYTETWATSKRQLSKREVIALDLERRLRRLAK